MILRLAQPTLNAANLCFKKGNDLGPPFTDKWIKGVPLTLNHIINRAFASYSTSPLKCRSTLGDAVEGFLAFAGGRGYV